MAASLLQNLVQRLVHESHSLQPFLTVEVQSVPAGGQSLRAKETRQKVSLDVGGGAKPFVKLLGLYADSALRCIEARLHQIEVFLRTYVLANIRT